MRIVAAPVKVTRSNNTKPKVKTTNAIKSPFPRLADPSKKALLIKQFSPMFETFYSAPQLSGYLAAAIITFFNDKKVYSYRQQDYISPMSAKPDKAYTELASTNVQLALGTGNFTQKVKITDNNVILYTNPINLTFDMNIPNPQDEGAKQDLLTYMKGLFPAFKLPTAWQYTPNSEPPITFIMGNDEITTGWKNLDAFTNLPLDEATNNSYVPKLDFKGTNEDISQAAYASIFGIVTLNKIGSYNKYALSIEGKENATGNLMVGVSSAKCYVTVQTQIRLPFEMALWMIMQKHPNEFNPKVFHEFASLHMSNMNGRTKIKNLPQQTMTMKSIHESNVARMQEYSLDLKNRVNEDNFLISANGNILHIPNVNNIATYDSVQKSAFDPASGEILPDHKIPALKNLPVYTDLVNEVFAYTGSEGALQYEKLSGSVALDNVTIAKYLKRKPVDLFGVNDPNKVEYESASGPAAENLFTILETLIREGQNAGLDLMAANPAGYTQITSIWSYLCSINDTVAEIFTFNVENMSNTQRGMTQCFIDTTKNLLGYIDKQKTYGIATLMDVRFWLVFFSKYATSPGKYLAHYNESVLKNIPAPVTELPKSIDLPNLGKGISILPHQIQAIEQSKRGPELMVLDYAPGAGKCQVGSTLVHTNNGLLSLKEIYELGEKSKSETRSLDNFKIISSEGKKSAIQAYKTKGETIRVKFNDGTIIEGLAEHRYHNSTKFVRLDEMKLGDFFPKSIGHNLYGNISKLQVDEDCFYSDKMTPELARLLGYLVSEGTLSEKYELISVTAHNKEVQADIIRCLDAVFGDEEFNFPKFGLSIRKHAHKEYLYKVLNRATSARQAIPPCIRQATKEIQCEFLKALFEGDGSIYEKDTNRWKIEYGTISPILAYELKAMLENMGYYVLLHKKKGYYSNNGNAAYGMKVTKRHPYALFIIFPQFEQYQSEIGFVSKKKVNRLIKAVKHLKHLETKAQQNTNTEACGWNNIMPSAKLLGNALKYLDSLGSKYTYVVPFGNQQRTLRYSFGAMARDLGSNLGKKHEKSVIKLGKNPNATRFTAQKILDLVDALPNGTKLSKKELLEIKNDVRLQKGLDKIRNHVNNTWIYITGIERTNKVKPVYDLVVPDVQNYVSNGMLSHNTVCSIADILVQKINKRAGVAVVICPKNLVKEWCSEIVKFSKGKINAIPLTSNTVQKVRQQLGMDRAQFLNYCRKAPPNTIFVTAMRFLSLKSDKFNPDNKSSFEVIYGKTTIRQYPQVWFIRQLNPDYIVIDESHYSKSSKAQITEVIKQISAFAKYKRLASGTLVTNRGDDLIGQFSILNPAIYGDQAKFFDKYAITGGRGGKRFEAFKPGAEKLIRSDATPYTSWLTKRRADWSFLLPKINTQFWNCELTENQAKFYEDLINEAVDEVKNDKNLQKLLEEGDPDLQDMIDKKMELYLAKVEIFVNAPDDPSLAFSNLSYIKNVDLVSPKVRLCEKLCRMHFEGGSFEGISFTKESSKVIIFAYNKATTEHFRRNFKPGYKTVFYQAGDEKAIVQFRQDPSIKILVASENSLREGLNLQCCFPGHTQVLTDYNTSVSIKDIYENDGIDHVLAYDLKNKKIIKKKIIEKLRYKVKDSDDYVRIRVLDPVTGKTKSLLVTANHQIFLKSGDEVRADQLKPGNQLITCNKFENEIQSNIESFVNAHYLDVLSVEKVIEKEEIGEYKYDLSIEGSHNYFACAGSSPEQRMGSDLIPILVHNSSRLIRLQTLWSPGNQEQAVSRVMRPDVGNNFNRKEINYDWIVTNNTLEIAKTCRLISKIVSNLTVSEGNNPEFSAFYKQFNLEDLELIRMNFDTIRDINKFEDIPAYSDAWGSYLTYEYQQFAKRKDELRHLVAKKLGIPVSEVTDAMLTANAFTPVVSTGDIPGSRSIWTPLAMGSVPYDPFGLDLKPLIVLEQSEEEESEDNDNDESEAVAEENPINEGDLVYTEYGMGYIRAIQEKRVKVEIPGFSKLMTIGKAFVFKPMNEEAAAKVKKVMRMRGSKGITFINGFDHLPMIMTNPKLNVKVAKDNVQFSPKNPASTVAPTRNAEDDEDIGNKHIQKNKDRLPGKTNQMYPIEVGAGIFDGLASVYMFTDSEHLQRVLKTVPINVGGHYPQFVYRHVRTWQGLKDLIAALENNFNMPDSLVEQLMNAGKKLYHRGAPKLIQRTNINANYKSFLQQTAFKANKDPHHFEVYPLIMNGQMYVVASIANQPRQAKIFQKLRVPGVAPALIHEPMTVLFFRTPDRAIRYIHSLRQHFKVAGSRDATNMLRNAPANFFRI